MRSHRARSALDFGGGLGVVRLRQIREVVTTLVLKECQELVRILL